MQCQISFPPYWVDASRLEVAIRVGGDPHASRVYEVLIRFPVGCKIMIDAAIRLLALANQLALTTRRVRLDFAEGESGTMGYLNRMGFFDHLAPTVEVAPSWPHYSGAAIYRGGNTALVEIARINKDARDRNLPTRLTEALMRSCGQRADAAELEGAAWTIFCELIDNVFSHSETPLDGYAALQAYQGGDRLTVAVSDSGLGIMQTLRPSLHATSPRMARLSDLELLVEVFREGLSRHGADRGCGLKGSAAKAMKFKADLDVRLPQPACTAHTGTRRLFGKHGPLLRPSPLALGNSHRILLPSRRLTMPRRSASMKPLNAWGMNIRLRDFMDEAEGWGRAEGRAVYQRMLEFVEAHSGVTVFRISTEGVRRVDISFASETIVELARRYRGSKGFCLVDVANPDMIENWEAAAARKSLPLVLWEGKQGRIIGLAPSQGNREALSFALSRGEARAAEFAEAKPGMSIANASTKFKQLWERGFLLRRESVAEAGGVEFVYHCIG
jgi:hypothetical protein